ncbi:MAG: IS4 family transposase [Pirellulaceae bacterium]
MEVSLELEFSGCNFGDERLTKRLTSIGTKFGERPSLSIPASLESRAEMEAAYRFFDNDEVTPERILSTHRERALKRIMQQKVCLLVQDTTELELTRPKQQVAGAGPLSADSRRGAYLHPLVAFTPERLNLGTVWQKSWARDAIDTTRTAKEKSKHLETVPIDDKESHRWIEGQREARRVAEMCSDTQCVLVCDSESDIYELLSEPRETSHGRPLEILIRACQDRATDIPQQKLLDTVRASEVIHTTTVEVSERTAKTKVDTSKRGASRIARSANLVIKACEVSLRPPERPDRTLPPVTLNVVLAEELNPPAGQPAVQWLLLTTLPIASLDEVLTIIDYYCCRWPIENFFKVLKSGCRVEERQFETLDRELNAIAVYLIAAWRIHLLVHLGREVPELDCNVLFEESEWMSICIVVDGKAPEKTPTLNEFIRKVSSLGGYVNRKKTEPGYQTLWIGLQRMHDLATAYQAFGPGSKIQNQKRGVVR